LEVISVTVQNSWSKNDLVNVSNIVAANPTITEILDDLNTDAQKLTIKGKGFDALSSAANVISSFSTEHAKALGPDILPNFANNTLKRRFEFHSSFTSG